MYSTFTVRVGLDEAVDLDLEGFLDLIAERAGHPLLMDFTYKVVGHEGDTLILEVTGDTSESNVVSRVRWSMLTRREAAELLGVSYNGIRKMEARGELHPQHEVREGTAFAVFTVDEVRKLVERRLAR